MVGSGVWVMVGRGCNGLWLKWVVGRGSAKLHMASLSSLIVDWRAGFGSVDGGFEMVDLLIGWVVRGYYTVCTTLMRVMDLLVMPEKRTHARY